MSGDNLRNLGVDHLDVVNLRVGGMLEPSKGSIEEPLTALAELKRQGLVRHIGLSNVTPRRVRGGGRQISRDCLRSGDHQHNVARRSDDAFIDALAKQGIAYVPFFPLGGFTPLQSSELDGVASAPEAETGMQVRLWPGSFSVLSNDLANP